MKKINFIEKNAGVSWDDKAWKFVFNYTEDSPGDLIDLFVTELKEATIFENTYLYGYKFNDDAPRNLRTPFIREMKEAFTGKTVSEIWEKFVIMPIILLAKRIKDTNCVIFPDSQRTRLNYVMVRYIGRYVHRDNLIRLSLIKKDRSDVTFDYLKFENDQKYSLTENKYNKYLKEIDKIMDKINSSSGYFSLAKEVSKSLYREYMRNYLEFSEKNLEYIAQSIDDKKVLLVDDINTSQSTIIEALNIINSIAIPKETIIFALLGKSYSDFL
jgi:phosphoribosylpyrophosphate synthetase